MKLLKLFFANTSTCRYYFIALFKVRTKVSQCFEYSTVRIICIIGRVMISIKFLMFWELQFIYTVTQVQFAGANFHSLILHYFSSNTRTILKVCNTYWVATIFCIILDMVTRTSMSSMKITKYHPLEKSSYAIVSYWLKVRMIGTMLLVEPRSREIDLTEGCCLAAKNVLPWIIWQRIEGYKCTPLT